MSLPGIIDDPAKGDPSGVRSLASTFTARGSSATARQTDASTALSSLASMTSSAADALGVRVTLLAQRFGEGSTGLTDIAAIVNTYASELETLKSEASRKLRAAQNSYDHIFVRRAEALNAATEFVTGWALNWDNVLPSWMYADDPGYLVRWQDAIDQYRGDRATYNALAEERQGIDSRAVNALAAVPLVVAVTRGGTVGAKGFGAASMAWAGNVNDITAESLAALGDPDIIRETWNSMDQTARDALIAASPLIIGNLNGIPIRDRSAANDVNIKNEIERREAEVMRLLALIANDPMSETSKTYSEQIKALQEPIEYWQSLLDQPITWTDQDGVVHHETGARVVIFDPTADAIATYHGPIDPVTGDIPAWVRNVAVSVPGTTTTMTSFADDVGRDIQAASGYDTALFQWAGGRFPLNIPEAMTWGYAETLAPLLRDFVAGIDQPAGSDLTVLGHSYGGATVGLAEKAGLEADRILYVSAAGMGHGVSGLEDFPHTGDVPHYSMMARNDSVVGAIQPAPMEWMHGQSAVEADGVTRLETGWIDHKDPNSTDLEDYNEPGNGTPAPIDAHSTVFTPGSTAFTNIVAVITGGEAVVFAEDGFIKTPRTSVRRDGIDMPGYEPEYTTIE